MKKTLIVLSSNREIEQRTRVCLAQARAAGALIYEQRGSSDVACARNIALSGACNALRGHKHVHDVVLMVDDDMTWTPDNAQAIVDLARASGTATSAMYSTYDAKVEQVSIAAQLLPEDRRILGAWVTGLGFLAVPAALLLTLEQGSESWDNADKRFVEFTWSKRKYERWWSEDYCFTERLGGVELAPFSVGHIKKIPIWPSDELVAKLLDQLEAAP